MDSKTIKPEFRIWGSEIHRLYTYIINTLLRKVPDHLMVGQ
ncbi:hypothetical protein SAMN05444412_11418 [Rhodonellum ikkaensis]|uniref:Uncharacterized protein n=1 Tax=Rhodonellum ikkaensis TaxID=336829 RepID=A0A1H3SX39_9BACT|nr:hypothetical protein SAMN05444412_11418 [Rhodonellum ikkaensis]